MDWETTEGETALPYTHDDIPHGSACKHKARIRTQVWPQVPHDRPRVPQDSTREAPSMPQVRLPKIRISVVKVLRITSLKVMSNGQAGADNRRPQINPTLMVIGSGLMAN